MDARTEVKGWRPEPESNRRARICSPLRNHSAIGPPGADLRALPTDVKPATAVCPAHQCRDERAAALAGLPCCDSRTAASTGNDVTDQAFETMRQAMVA